jgi:D-alanyl-D-alanine carboxypeptidase/D-alanyl-D-alanine-endopeptidase (penicillin-binding protein 4)
LEQVEGFLKDIGVAEQQFNFEDASGLSRLTLVTPRTIAKLLVHMYNSQHRDVWVETLPVGGVDGTLYSRFDKSPLAANIRAKTGTISHVSSLSGYALRPDGRVYAFAILANNFNAASTPIRKVTDQIALALLD